MTDRDWRLESTSDRTNDKDNRSFINNADLWSGVSALSSKSPHGEGSVSHLDFSSSPYPEHACHSGRSEWKSGHDSQNEGDSADHSQSGGDLLVNKLLSDPTMMKALEGAAVQMSPEGLTELEHSLEHNLRRDPNTTDGVLAEKALAHMTRDGASASDLSAMQSMYNALTGSTAPGTGTGSDSAAGSTTPSTGAGSESTGNTFTPVPATGGDTTPATTSGTDPILQQFAQSDPELAQILTDSKSQMSAQGFSQFEQLVAQNWASGQYADDGSLLQQSLSQFQSQGGSAADTAAANNVIQSDMQTYGNSNVSTYYSNSSPASGAGGEAGATNPATTPVTGGDGAPTTAPATGGDGAGTSATTTSTEAPPPTVTSSTGPTSSSGSPLPDVPSSLNAPTKLVLDDEFNTGSLNTNLWSPNWFGNGNTQNNTVMNSSNVSVDQNGLELKLNSNNTGGIVSSNPDDGQPGHTGFEIAPTPGKPVYVEYTANLPAASNGQIANWPALWLTGQNWPTTGEIDVMEGFGTSQYHIESGPSPSDVSNPGGVGGTAPGTHTYGVLWSTTGETFVYDGQVVGTENVPLSGPMFLAMENSSGSPSSPDTMTVRDVRVYQDS